MVINPHKIIEDMRKHRYIEGRCWICGNNCEPESYAHYDCALAFSEDLQTQTKKVMEESGN